MLHNKMQIFDKYFIVFLGLFLLTYFVIEIELIPHLTLFFDEFWFAQHISQYTHLLPYRDFLPYKTTLGYYILSLAFFIKYSVLPHFTIKAEIALLNTLAMGAIALLSMRFFNKQAILITLVLIVINQMFLFQSIDLRVDMLTAWFGLISVLFILYRRNVWAGVFFGISFLCSQKALWFFLAINSAFLVTFFLKEKKIRIRDILRFNSSSFAVIAIYFVIWSYLASPSVVWQNMFYEAYTQAKISWYSQVYFFYWRIILANGCLLITLLPLTWLMLFEKPLKWERVFIASFGFVMALQIITYQQPFPYNMVFFVPVFFLVYADFFSSLIAQRLVINVNKRFLFWFTSIYIIFLLGIFICLEVGIPYYLILLIPALFSYYLENPASLTMTLCILSLFFTGVFYPLIRIIDVSLARNNSYQLFNLNLLNDLLKKEGDYFAGTPMLYDKKQEIIGLENLISPAIAYLYHPSPKLVPLLIPSLYLFPTTPEKIIEQLRTKPVKVYVNNVRIAHLPPVLLAYLEKEFSHYWGSIYIYSPQIDAHEHNFFLKFDGRYKVVNSSNSQISIDHQKIISNSIIELRKGFHVSKSDTSYRLKWVPSDIAVPLRTEYRDDNWVDVVR